MRVRRHRTRTKPRGGQSAKTRKYFLPLKTPAHGPRVLREWLKVGAAAMALSLAIAHADARPPTPDRGANSNAAVAERIHPGYEAKGLPLGVFRAFPTFTAEVQTTDNLFASSSNEQSDVIYFARPAVTIESDWSRHHLTFDAAAARSFHTDFPKDDVTTATVGADLTLDVLHSTQAGLGARWRQDSEGRSSPDTPAGALSPVEYEATSLTAFAAHTFNRIRLTATATREEIDYDDVFNAFGVIDQDDRDHTATRASFRAEYGLSPDTAFLLETRYDSRDYDYRPANPALVRDSSGAAVLAGVNFDVTRLVRGEIAAGYFAQDYDAVGETNGLAVDANFQWFPTQLTTVTINAARRADDSGAAGAVSVLLTSGGVRVDHELRRNIVLSAELARADREYKGPVDRADEVWTGQLAARWQLNRRVGLSAGVAHERQDSTGVNRDRDFEINRAFAALTLRL